MIDERMEEQASLYVLGILSETEQRDFLQAMQKSPELQAYVKRLTAAAGAVAGSVAMVEPPPQLRAKILAQVAPQQKVIALPERKFRPFAWLPWSFATGFAIIAAVLFLQGDRLQQQIVAQNQQVNDLKQLAQSLQNATNDLQQTVLALRETNRLANLRIAMLNSLIAENPKAVAVSLWDDSKQEGVFVVQNLKPLAADRDYQLWVLENGTTPVDAGVFHVDSQGDGRTEFKAKLPIKVAGKFAVTEEIHGGEIGRAHV